MPLKPYGSPTQLFTKRWQDEVSPVPESGMAGTVRVYDPNLGDAEWDFDAGEWTGTAPDIYTGPARIQPLRSTNDKAQPGDSTTVQQVLVSIPVSRAAGVEFETFHQAVITASPLNADLGRYVFALRELMDSTNPLERTLIFTVNQEARNG